MEQAPCHGVRRLGRSLFGEAPTGGAVENGILVVFRLANGKIAERGTPAGATGR